MVDITGQTQYYIPFSSLESSPITLIFNSVPVTIVLLSSTSCLITVPSKRYFFVDSDSPNRQTVSACAALGTPFILAYHGEECEVRLGRRITVLDPNT